MVALLGGHNAKWQIFMASEKVAIFCDQVIGTYPFRIRRDESVCGFKPGELVFGSEFKRNHEILIDLSETPDERKDFPKDVPRKIPANLVDNEARHADGMAHRVADDGIQQSNRSRFLRNSEGKEVLVAIEDEAQPFLPRVPRGSSEGFE